MSNITGIIRFLRHIFCPPSIDDMILEYKRQIAAEITKEHLSNPQKTNHFDSVQKSIKETEELTAARMFMGDNTNE